VILATVPLLVTSDHFFHTHHLDRIYLDFVLSPLILQQFKTFGLEMVVLKKDVHTETA
jgi:hypothetical protein